MGYRCFDVSVDEIDERVAHIVLNRPEKRNSMIPEFWDELPEIVRDIDDNSRARAIVLSSTGPHFSSGLDVKAFALRPEAGRRVGIRTRSAVPAEPGLPASTTTCAECSGRSPAWRAVGSRCWWRSREAASAAGSTS
jgi:enoyl-CoA hydratase